MPHSTSLIATIVVGLVLAFGFGFAARRLHLPPLVGYLLAGIAIGPFTPGFVADISLAGQLAEIGIILLMFGIGLHFSIKDLLEVYPIALPGALAQIAASTTVCAAMAVLWGWGLVAGLLLGLGLSVASTVVLLRVLEERNALDKVDGRIAIGWLIVQDLAMVLVLVLLPALAGSSEGQPSQSAPPFLRDGVGVTLALTLAKVAAFVALVLIVGTRLVPWLLEQVAPDRLARAVYSVGVGDSTRHRLRLGGTVRGLLRARRLLRRRGAERIRSQPPSGRRLAAAQERLRRSVLRLGRHAL
jgi:monovalent cation:H+ antiporter-2, CPA2 family